MNFNDLFQRYDNPIDAVLAFKDHRKDMGWALGDDGAEIDTIMTKLLVNAWNHAKALEAKIERLQVQA